MPDFAGRAQLHASSGNKANAAAVATLAHPDSSHTVYITGFEVTASGSTAALVVTVTVTGVAGGTLSYTFVFPAGVGVQAQPLVVNFDAMPIQASGPGVDIVVTCPAGGAGNTNAVVNAHGFIAHQ